ncbi:MAG: GTPase ObgE [Bacteroidetes bacterium]|nr:GTPase ObgE [Bacteroidota bacterium]
MKFIDLARIRVKAGDGGAGCVSFRREKYVPRGGPDGGNGGRGGSIVLRANRQLSTLLDYTYRRVYQAPRGQHGLGSRKTGPSGSDVVLDVPTGTLVRDCSTGEILADLVNDGDRFVVARRGIGGRGNAEFATPTNQAPRHCEVGKPGEEREIELELKLLADSGLVGLPNAGKSTLISVISAARPKIADYPFTTLTPNLGIVRVDIGKSFVVADIPGLIEGAHDGKGLGLLFLRHIERTKVLVILLDGTRNELPEDYEVLLNELKLFNPDLLEKTRMIAITKTDSVEADVLASLRKMRFGKVRPSLVSAVTGDGIRELVHRMWEAIQGG